MTQREFIQHIRKAYLKARLSVYKPSKHIDIIKRGTSHSISSIAEDLFACYCADKVKIPYAIKILIDPPISFTGSELKNKSGKKSLLIRPDIALSRNNEIVCLFDIKTDLGYKRKDFYNQAEERNIQMESIKKQIGQFKDGQTKIAEQFKISKNIKFIYIIISQGNISKGVQQKFLNDIRELKNVYVFLLSTGDHLNSYHDLPSWKINKEDFDSLDNILNSYLN